MEPPVGRVNINEKYVLNSKGPNNIQSPDRKFDNYAVTYFRNRITQINRLPERKWFFFVNGMITGRTELVQYGNNTNDINPARLPFAEQEEATSIREDILRSGVIEGSNSPWSLPVGYVNKKDKSTLDYRKLREVTKNDSDSLHKIDDNFYVLAGSTLYLKTCFGK